MKPSLRHALLIAAIALAVRAVYLAQLAGSPFFAEPLVDARTYHDLAVALAERGVFDQHFLWQAPLYPLALAGLYTVFGASVAVARVAGSLLGVATALLTWRLGCRLLGPRGGLAAGLAVALNGVLVFFEAELLATGLATFWAVALVALLVELGARPRARVAVLLGAATALAMLTRTLLLPPVLAGLGWATWRLGWRRTVVPVLLAAAGFAAVAAPFAAISQRHTGHAGLVPPSGAINLYLGNNPDFPATLDLRPGLPWEELVARPVADTGIDDPWVNAGWFRARVRRYVTGQPGSWLADLGTKLEHLVSTRELPRNVDVYLQRTWSPLLAMLVWKIGGFGFPAGVILPLGIVGLAAARRRLTGLLPLFVGVYALGLLLVFTAARYRAPLWPLLTIAAVATVMMLTTAGWRWRLGCIGGVIVLLVLGTAPGPFAQESVDLEAELWHGVGFNQLRRNETAAAAASFRRAVAVDPAFAEAWNRLGVALARQDSFAASIPCFERALALAPTYPDPPGNLELARSRAAQQRFEAARRLEGEGRPREAAAALRASLEYLPDWPEAQARLAWILATTDDPGLRDGHEALALARAALAGHGEEHPWLLEVLAAAERAARDQN